MILIDTHILVWAVFDDRRLTAKARRRLDAELADGPVFVSAITPWEIAMLAAKGKLALGKDVGDWVELALAQPGLRIAPISPSIAVASVSLPANFHGDPADRFIVATARELGAPLMTVDRAILDYAAAGHLNAIDARR